MDMFRLFITLTILETVACFKYTYWRYGDGNFSNSLPENHNLISNGLLPNDPIYTFEESTNNNTIFFYPLITENNDIFVLKKNISIYYQDEKIYECDESLSLIKLNEYLNETLSILPLISNPNELCHAWYFYPIYHKQNNNEYIVINIYMNQTGPLSNTYAYYNSILWIINATNMDIITSITSTQFLYIINKGDGKRFYYPPAQFIIHNEYIFYMTPISIEYPIKGNYTTISLSTGDILWSIPSINISETINYYSATPIAMDNKVIVPMNNALVALNLSNGEIVYNISLSYSLNSYYVSQTVIYNRYNLLLIPTISILDKSESLFIVNGINGAVITILNLELNGEYSPINLAINDYNNVGQLLLTKFVDYVSNFYYDSTFRLYDMNVSKDNNDNIKVTFNEKITNIFKINVTQMESVIFYFIDSNSLSMIGVTNYSMTKNPANNIVTNWYENMYPIFTKQLKLAENEIMMKTNAIPIQKYRNYPQSDHYPAVSNNGFIYFVGLNAIYAYDMILQPDDDDNLFWFWIIGGAAIVVIIIVIILLIRSYWTYCCCNYKKNKKGLLN